MDPITSRKMHRTLEPYHALVYLVAEAGDAYRAVGLEPGRMSYFAPRAAPMGAVPAEVVIATFFGFSPAVVRPVIPTAWSLASPADILSARLALVDGALRRILGDEVIESPEIVEAATLARRAADASLGATGSTFLTRQAACIAGGTTEMSRNVVSERVLGMPRERTLDKDVPFKDVPKGPPTR